MHINDLIDTLKKMNDLPVFIGSFKRQVNLITFIYKDGCLTKHQIAITFTNLKEYKPLKSSEITVEVKRKRGEGNDKRQRF